MDHVDWQDLRQARALAAVLARQVAPGGRVIWRSAALCPPYARVIREAGFEVCARPKQALEPLLQSFTAWWLWRPLIPAVMPLWQHWHGLELVLAAGTGGHAGSPAVLPALACGARYVAYGTMACGAYDDAAETVCGGSAS